MIHPLQQPQPMPPPPPCSVGPLLLLARLCHAHPPALSLSLARLCGAPDGLADNCAAALEARDPWSTAPLLE